MKEKWVLRNPQADLKHITETFGTSELLAYILAGKNLKTDEEIDAYLNPNASQMHSWTLFKDMNKAVQIIKKAIDNGEKICVVGDYDCDGICSTTLLVTGIRELGGFVSYQIPDRITDGYGISFRIIDKALEDGTDLIITCDNGIAAKEQVAYAKEKGLTVIVTDHHNVPEGELVAADAVVDPKQKDCDYPFEGICGAVVAAKLMEALYEDYGFGSFIEKNIDIMALATVVDVMDLVDENRYIVKRGLELITSSNRLGINALKEATGLSDKPVSVYHLGFVLGPSLNSTGRLETADKGVELLLCEDHKEAAKLAAYLAELNASRKTMTENAKACAVKLIEESELKNDNVLVLYMPELHESLAGIVAGRLKESFNRPAIVFTDAMDSEELLKGSARSVDEYNIYDGLTEVSDLLVKFGGHPKAAGLTIKRETLDELRKSLNKNCKEDLVNMEKKVTIDANIPMSSFSEALLEELEKLEPCGNGNRNPVFVDRVTLKSAKRFGKESQFLSFIAMDGRGNGISELKCFDDALMDAYKENYGDEEMVKLLAGRGDKVVNMIYRPQINEFRGNRTLQFIVNNYSFPRCTP